MDTKHTPGPWQFVISGTCSAAWPHICAAENDVDNSIAELPPSHLERDHKKSVTFLEDRSHFKPSPNYDQVVANARLISAAPELLEALEKALIALNLYADYGWSDRMRIRSEAKAAIAKATGAAA